MQLSVNYNLNASGRNISLLYSKENKKENEFGVGLRYFINRITHPDDQFCTFYRRQYVGTSMRHFGLQAFYNKRIINKWNIVKPFVFYDLQLSYSKTRGRSFLPYTYDVNGDVLYKEYINYYGPYLWIEQSLGLGYKTDLDSHFFITSKIGFETMILNGTMEEMIVYGFMNVLSESLGICLVLVSAISLVLMHNIINDYFDKCTFFR